jgi:Sec-independent protein translocase protein TatA
LELVAVLVIALIVLGPGKLPDVASGAATSSTAEPAR